MVKDAGALEARIAYVFGNKALLQRALTHRSANVAVSGHHMERLEFLGDAVLGLVISAYLHQNFVDKQEGDLSRMRAAVVRKEALLQVADNWKLVNYLNVGDSERIVEHGRVLIGVKSPSIAANAVEAVIGAVFEDAGWDAAQCLVMRAWAGLLQGIDAVDTRDAKSRLQELTQAQGWGLPEYALMDLGVGVSPRFKAICRVQGDVLSKGVGDRKKTAESEAAEQAWQQLKT